ncbi:unnamed protein product [Heligmosomoides polygyrus]|uniref:Pre-rRNA-processing protein TSR2 homolog n=1 Tax=Heligmosomoides polygyrus TaxID=6339 RepID=A0A183GCU0_HELPZ|nr:unnamed protein product [Heligmosomoides polygyrus]
MRRIVPVNAKCCAAPLGTAKKLLQQDEFVGDTSDEEVVEKERDGEIVDTRIGFYGILLARVQDSWSRGALPGATAHIIVAILEHGIDEGKITADDIEHHLEMVQPNFEDAIVFTVSNWLYVSFLPLPIID